MSRNSGPVWTGLVQTYRSLPDIFYSELTPNRVAAPKLSVLNRPLAQALGLDAEALASPDNIQVLAGNVFPEGLPAIAQATPVEDRNLEIARQAIVLQAVVAENQIDLGMRCQQGSAARW